MEKNTITNTSYRNEKHIFFGKVLVIAFGIVLSIFLIGIISYTVGSHTSRVAGTPTSTPAIPASLPTRPMSSSLQLYTNNQFSFSLAYPPIYYEVSEDPNDYSNYALLKIINLNDIAYQNSFPLWIYIFDNLGLQITDSKSRDVWCDIVSQKLDSNSGQITCDKGGNFTKTIIGQYNAYQLINQNDPTMQTFYLPYDTYVFKLQATQSVINNIYPTRTYNQYGTSILNSLTFINQNRNVIPMSVPITTLQTQNDQNSLQDYTYQQTATFSAQMTYSNSLSGYGAGGYTIIAPSQWTGQGTIGTDGSVSVNLSSQIQSLYQGSITYSVIQNGTPQAFQNADPYFTWVQNNWQNYYSQTPQPSIDPSIGITTITPHLSRYSTTNGTMEITGIAYSDAQNHQNDSNWSFQKMEIVMPKTQHDLALQLLNIYIQNQNLLSK